MIGSNNITMVREKVTISTRTLQWKCVDSRADSKRLYYGRFVLSPLLEGQADTIGIVMRRALLGEIEGTCITRAKSKKIPHEYSTIVGIQESVHEILMNLKKIVLRSNLYGTCDASICVKGLGYVTAQDIISPPYVEIVDNTQHIASLTEPIDLCIRLQIERNRGYRIKSPNNFQDGSYPIDAVFMPVRNANHSTATTVLGMFVVLVFLLVYEEMCTSGELLWYCYCLCCSVVGVAVIQESFSSTRTVYSPHVFRCIKWYQSVDSPSSMTQVNGEHTIPIDVDHRVKAIWDEIEKHQPEVHKLRNEICNLFADLGLIVNQRQP
ncbi:hypothetical protein TEA_006019 [Camellia sinensis var. sinensis]|uniref:DNA-directed RNA polymerase n=1 Tax=Camellia sinensis var. sinensis TaxID=542762 RepID=A0A4S4DZB0_CAMSN|nr:hypothetical protein TEA_006019 [Camellia sinensis var. sinensis]